MIYSNFTEQNAGESDKEKEKNKSDSENNDDEDEDSKNKFPDTQIKIEHFGGTK